MHEYIFGGPLRWYGTLRYGDVNEKFNFLKIQNLGPLNFCQKIFWNDLAEYALSECEIY